MRRVAIASWALTDMPMARSRVGLEEGKVGDEQESLLAWIVNAASADLEAAVGGRALKSRSYTGSKVQKLTADGARRILLPQYPATAVASVKWVDLGTGTKTALDLTGLYFDANYVDTPNDSAPSGTRVEVDCTAGYLAGFDETHDRMLQLAEDLVLRIVQIKWHLHHKHIGMGLELTTSNGRAKYTPTRIPEDVRDEMFPLVRL